MHTMQNDNGNWKVIYVASRFEKKVAQMLEKLSVHCYLPLVQQIRQWSDRRKKVQVPLFGGYVFVKPSRERRDEVLQIPGVVRYVQFNGKDAEVRPEKIEMIRNLIETGYDISQFSDQDEFRTGQKVKVSQGPLRGYSGEVIRMGSDNYALIAMEELAVLYKVKIPVQILQKIG